MRAVKEVYLKKMEYYLKEREKLDKQETKRQAEVDRALRSIERIGKKKMALSGPSWVEDLIRPLAEKFSEEYGWKHEIYGPFGLRSAVSIYWSEPKFSEERTIITYFITLVPGELEEGELWYETGERKGSFKKGTIGEINGMNNEMLPLPNDMEQIRELILARRFETPKKD